MTKAEKHLFEAEKSAKKARRHLARILIDECEGSEPLRFARPGLRRSENLLQEILDLFRRPGHPLPNPPDEHHHIEPILYDDDECAPTKPRPYLMSDIEPTLLDDVAAGRV